MDKILIMFNKWKNVGFDGETLDRFQHDIDIRNLKALRVFCSVYLVLNTLFFLLELFLRNSPPALVYIGFSFVFLLFCIENFTKVIKGEKSSKYAAMYVTGFTFLIYVSTAIWSTYIQPNDYGVFLICMLFFMPFVVTERPIKGLVQVILVVFIFSFLSFNIKTSFYAVSDTIHAVVAVIAGTMVSYTKNRQVLEEIIVADQLEKANEELKYLNTIDPLTEIFNRKKIFSIFEEFTTRSRQEGKDVACAIMDLDNFKIINDTYGHPQGDMILKHTGEIITKIVEKFPNVNAGRIGGEEFMLIAYDMAKEDFGKVCIEINHEINKLKIYNSNGENPFFASASCGFSVLVGDNVSNLYNFADKGLYHAKEHGKNCVWKYSVTKGEYILYKGNPNDVDNS
ncbi:MAG: GGDEF domain-containing protein [Anaerotignaceae bacterium]